MKTQTYLAVLAATMLQLFDGRAQSASAPGTSSEAADKLSSAAAEVEKLAQSGVGDDVILSYVGQSKAYYNLSAANIVELKNAGVSSQAVTAMLNHDNALRSPQQPSSATTTTASAPSFAPTNSAVAPVAAIPSATNTVVAVPPPQPAPQVEVVPVSPGPDYVWAPGYWSWNGGVWIWVGGRWHYPERPGHVWVGGYWSGRGRGRAWIGGHWR